ncbi:hypothetical protein [Rhodoferax sp.]|uniref:hypothetical protein n=1 Tax=Rhodoferax sp. TaxID=50421 RepID=UPI00283CC2D1|nr:hypothetical protein [Rhodoferax sp.]MDR3370548.1 hypothetical protein [Rhodoferax sp.]
MHSAPAVSYPVGRSHFYGQLLVAAVLLGGGSLFAWITQSDERAFRHMAGAALWLGSATAAIVTWLRSPHGLLTWDGQNWTWTCRDMPRQVELIVVLDSKSTLLLLLRGMSALDSWVWLERSAAPTRWLPLRRAVFAPQVKNAIRDADGMLP